MGAKGFSHTKGGGGGKKGFGVALTQKVVVLAILKGGGGSANAFHPSKGETQRVLPCLEAVGCTMIRTHDFLISPSLKLMIGPLGSGSDLGANLGGKGVTALYGSGRA